MKTSLELASGLSLCRWMNKTAGHFLSTLSKWTLQQQHQWHPSNCQLTCFLPCNCYFKNPFVFYHCWWFHFYLIQWFFGFLGQPFSDLFRFCPSSPKKFHFGKGGLAM
jgi:hypothetical protein